MDVSRRSILAGGGIGAIVGAVGLAGYWGTRYRSDLRVWNGRSTALTVDVKLVDPDGDEPVLDESVELTPDNETSWEGTMENHTAYRLWVETADETRSKEFTTCCRGALVRVLLEDDGIEILPTHLD